jgi:serine/threonine-protein kinase RsbW
VVENRGLEDTQVIRLEVPGVIGYRDVALRTVSAACRMAFRERPVERFQEFSAEIVSAVGEAFNNIALHGYRGQGAGSVEIHIMKNGEWMTVEMRDYGISFDPHTAAAPDLDAMPESGLGVFIIKSFVDRLEYQPGRPNVLKLVKRLG